MNIFVSYAHEEERARKRLLEMVSPLCAGTFWSDHKISLGDDWQAKIESQLETADGALLLISPAYLNSNYCQYELEKALERRKRDRFLLLPVVLSLCPWPDVFPDLAAAVQAFPTEDRAILRNEEIQEPVLVECARQIATAIRLPVGKAPKLHAHPPSLPYLCDREEQENEFEDLLAEHVKSRSGRPFLCVIFGSSRESHHGFLERLRAYSLRRILGLDAELAEQQVIVVSWPTYSQEAGGRKCMAALAEALHCKHDEVEEKLGSHSMPLILASSISSLEWACNGKDVTRCYLKLWEDWPDRPPTRLLIVCLMIQFAPSAECPVGQSPTWADPESVEDMRTTINTIRTELTRMPPRLSGGVLPELGPIPKSRTENFGRIHLNIPLASMDDWKEDVATVYKLHNTVSLPMLDLKPELSALIPKYWRPRG